MRARVMERIARREWAQRAREAARPNFHYQSIVKNNNMKRHLIAAIAVFGFCWQSVAAQVPFQMGLPSEPDAGYEDIPVKAPMTSSLYRDVSSKGGVKKYAPTPRSQGEYGTCAAWACGYAARTILEAKKLGITDKKEIDKHIFSYGFIYRITSSKSNCWGAFTSDMVKNMQNTGLPKLSDYDIHCPQSDIPQSVYNIAAKYKIKGYTRLWDESNYKTSKQRIDAMKLSLSNGNPVVISMICPNSFFSPTGGVWYPKEKVSDGSTHAHGRHAMCVVSYDDDKEGGAFEVQNSWGSDWGSGGYVWIRYNDFAEFVYQAFELHSFDAVNPNNEVELGGSFRLVADNGQEMKAKPQSDGTYKLDRAYRSGTRFRMYINNNEPAYVYAFGADGTNKTFQIFPHKPEISPALTYKRNEVAIPSETNHVRMDKTVGTDYFCVLYSKEPLNIEDIQTAFKQQSARLTFKQKIEAVLGDKLMKNASIKTDATGGRMSFSAKAKGGTVVALITAMEHID
jgi:hypothetical protein